MSMTIPNGEEQTAEGVSGIMDAEREARIIKARRLMVEAGLEAIVLESGPNLYYYTGIQWEQSERVMVAVIPARDAIAYVCPRFEEARLREMLLPNVDVRVWEEHESPFDVLAGLLSDRGIVRGRVGVEANLRFFVYEGIQRHVRDIELTSANPVTIPCRSEKSTAEIALLQRAADVTMLAFKECVSHLRAGISQEEFLEISIAAHRALGASGSIVVQFGSGTSSPHGSREPAFLKPNDVVLMDGGCTIEGYHSDISRTIIYGEPTRKQREIWRLEQAAQAAAFDAARLGASIGNVDAAARKVIVDAGLGPGYEVPGLPHRTGHGIGLEAHEAPYVVQENMIPLTAGMCFSNEPMICIPGQFGIRLEDCLHMTDRGPKYFTQPSGAIDCPFS